MADSLGNSARKGVAWTTVGSLGNYGVHFVFNIILARLLSPEDFGICFMPTIFYTLAHICVEGGFSSALIREPQVDEVDKNTAFWFRLVMGVAMYAMLWLGAPAIAGFYDTPVLVPIVRVSGLTLITAPCSMIPNVNFMRNLDFRTPALLGITGALLSGTISITLAFCGWGLWSIVWSGILTDVLCLILIMVVAPWWPKLKFSTVAMRRMLSFGSKMQASQILNTLAENITPIIIGKVYSGYQLGLYMRALNWARIPSSGLTGIVGKVIMPVFSRLQDDNEQLASAFRRINKVTAFVIFPLMMTVAAISDPMVRVLLTDKWADCIPYNQLLCFAMMWYPIHAINLQVLVSKGRSDLFLRLEVVKAVLLVASLPIFYFGIIPYLVTMALASPLLLVLNAYYTRKMIGVSLLMQLKDLLPIMLLAGLMYAAVWLCILIFNNVYLQFGTGLIATLIIYLLAGRYGFAEQQREVWRMLRRR